MHMFNDVLQTETHPENILHPARNIVNYLKRIEFEGLIYCIGSTVFKDVLKAAGFQLIDGVSTENIFLKNPKLEFDFLFTQYTCIA
jgi:ribonucleotide monophosphatase NagD (HAD superfamily)